MTAATAQSSGLKTPGEIGRCHSDCGEREFVGQSHGSLVPAMLDSDFIGKACYQENPDSQAKLPVSGDGCQRLPVTPAVP